MFYITILYIKCHYRERERDFRLLKKKKEEEERGSQKCYLYFRRNMSRSDKLDSLSKYYKCIFMLSEDRRKAYIRSHLCVRGVDVSHHAQSITPPPPNAIFFSTLSIKFRLYKNTPVQKKKCLWDTELGSFHAIHRLRRLTWFQLWARAANMRVGESFLVTDGHAKGPGVFHVRATKASGTPRTGSVWSPGITAAAAAVLFRCQRNFFFFLFFCRIASV